MSVPESLRFRGVLSALGNRADHGQLSGSVFIRGAPILYGSSPFGPVNRFKGVFTGAR